LRILLSIRQGRRYKLKFRITLDIDTDINMFLVLQEIENQLSDMKYNQKDELTQLSILNWYKISDVKNI